MPELAIGVDQVEDPELALGLRRRGRTPVGAELEAGEEKRPIGAHRVRVAQVLSVELFDVVGIRPQDEIQVHCAVSPP